MHLVSSEGVTGATQQSLFMPMLTRMPKARVKMLVVALSPNVVPGAVLRQNGVPVYDVALSKHRFSLAAFGQLLKTMRAFRPDVVHAWGHTAQVVSNWLRGRCDWDLKLVWTNANTAPLPRKAGFIDRQKLKYAASFSKRADSVVYTSEAGASAHRRVGFPEEGYTVVPLGVDPTRFKPDMSARRKIREQLGLGTDAFVIGMMAPFQPEYDHTTLFKAVGELIKTNPNVSVLLAGHGVQKGNAPLMALVGGGTLGTRTQLLGEWSDVAAFFNACDLACSSALTDQGRMSLVIAMLCGIPCVATGMGAQGEVIGQHGVAVEPGSPAALIRGITRILQMPQDKRAYMAQGARKHALTNFVSVRSLQKYLQLYYDTVGRKLEAATSVPAPRVDAAIPTPKPEEAEAPKPVEKPKTNRTVDMNDLSDPDSLESRDAPPPVSKPAEGDVLQMFESALASQATKTVTPMTERARGVAEVHEDLLSPEMIHGNETAAPSAAPSVESTNDAVGVAPRVDAAPAPVPTIMPTVASMDDLALTDTTITVSMKISLDATSTLEIPPEMIFTTVTTPRVATAAATATKLDVSVAAKDAIAAAASPVDIVDSSPKSDSTTVPALAVDALLSQSESIADAAPDSSDALQLDLLDAPVADRKVAG